eukprot:360879-Chlamydomonas_euryale.AAC.2
MLLHTSFFTSSNPPLFSPTALCPFVPGVDGHRPLSLCPPESMASLAVPGSYVDLMNNSISCCGVLSNSSKYIGVNTSMPRLPSFLGFSTRERQYVQVGAEVWGVWSVGLYVAST